MTRTTDRDRNDDFTPQGWTPADDDLVRSALLSLREDVDTVPLADPSFIRARHGQARPRSRTLAWAAGAAAAAVVVAAVAFSQLGRPEAGPVTPATSTAVVSPPPTGATPEPTGEATQEATDPAPGSTVEPCGAVVGTVNQEGVSAAAGARARTLMDAALECDSATLIALATDDQTELSFGVVSPEEAFDVANQRPEENRYALLSTLLTLRPQSDTQSGFYRWPAEPITDADWQALIDAGVISSGDRDLMIQGGSGYVGFRVVIDESGRWTAFIGGD